MPITPYLNGERFEPETKRVLGVAFEQVCIALRIGNSDDDVKQAIANKVVELAKAAEESGFDTVTFADRPPENNLEGWTLASAGNRAAIHEHPAIPQPRIKPSRFIERTSGERLDQPNFSAASA